MTRLSYILFGVLITVSGVAAADYVQGHEWDLQDFSSVGGDFTVGDDLSVAGNILMTTALKYLGNTAGYTSVGGACTPNHLTPAVGEVCFPGKVEINSNLDVDGQLGIYNRANFLAGVDINVWAGYNENQITGDVTLGTSSGNSVYNYVTASSADIAVSLPSAASCLGQIHHIKRMDATTWSVTVDSSDLIDGNASVGLNQWDSLHVRCNEADNTWSIH
jgi:hypothetical protein